jgi:anti-sigma regulatory factor (Ser/Thr protein kinase)
MTHAPSVIPVREDASAVSGCQLTPSPEAARRARTFTRQALASWGLAELSDDAEVVVGELLANAVRHADLELGAGPGAAVGLWLLRHQDGLMCVVTDPSDAEPALRRPCSNAEGGRGLQVIHSLSDHWGWSPFGARGKAVWAILFRG